MSNRPLVPQAKAALDQFKAEISNELGIENPTTAHGYMGSISSHDAGQLGNFRGGNIGGEMVKRMIAAAERDMIDNQLL